MKFFIDVLYIIFIISYIIYEYNKFISELKKKNPKWDKITIGCEHSNKIYCKDSLLGGKQ